MEINKQNKELFFSQYYGQEVIGIQGSKLRYPCKPEYWGSDIFRLEEQYLFLKSLLKITDEDVLGAIKSGYGLAFMGNNSVGKWKCIHSEKRFISVSAKYSIYSFEFDKEGCPLIDMYDEKEITNVFSNEFAYQYLQLKGYALDWMGIRVDEQVKAGWVKLID